jgi:hypothetical protein
MHELMIFFGTLGGLFMFGMAGLLIGPVIASLFITIWEIYGEAFKDVLPAVRTDSQRDSGLESGADAVSGSDPDSGPAVAGPEAGSAAAREPSVDEPSHSAPGEHRASQHTANHEGNNQEANSTQSRA